MVRKLALLAVLGSSVALAALAACASSSSGGGAPSCNGGGADGGTCTPGTTPAYTSCVTGGALQSPAVSFAKDVQPIFNRSCGIAGGTCHGDPNNTGQANGQIFLGIPDGGVDAAQVIGLIVGQQSPENSTLKIVQAGDPSKSYLMHKLDYDQCAFASDCAAAAMANPVFANCGSGMPLNSGTLDVATRDSIRRWIAQGAQNN